MLFSRQGNLRHILSHHATVNAGEQETDSTFFLRHLMSSAILPSPIKALFDREELEVPFALIGSYNLRKNIILGRL